MIQLKAETTFDRLVEMPDHQVSDKLLPTAQLLSHRFLSLYPLLSLWASFKAWWTCFPYTRKFPCQHSFFAYSHHPYLFSFTRMHLCKQQYKYYVCVQLAKFSWGLRVDQNLELLFWAMLLLPCAHSLWTFKAVSDLHTFFRFLFLLFRHRQLLF